MDNRIAPRENIDTYCMLYVIETALRELIVNEFLDMDGPKWVKKRLPGDILTKYREAIAFERSIPWTSLIPHHPIYYIDFPDLKKIIEREDNWKDIFKIIFSRKDILSSTISELEPIRNKVAHNRRVSLGDVDVVKGAYTKLAETIGVDRFHQLATTNTLISIDDKMQQLQKEAEKSFDLCMKYKQMDNSNISIWLTVRDQWWFDETYLGHSIDGIRIYFELLEQYKQLPRVRGRGHEIESWVKAGEIDKKYKACQVELLSLLNYRR